ncbi:MAG: GerMN domain-containing protein [Patescibacteria group bacterium]
MEEPKNKYKILEFLILVLAVVLIVKYAGTSSSRGSVAGAFEWEKEANVYFIDRQIAETTSCEATVVVKRKVPNAETLGPGVLDALIKGLSSKESRSLYTSIDPAILLQKFEIKNKVAFVDFSSLGQNIGGSCKVIAIRSQIEKTLTDLPDINSVVISVNGETEGILEP